LGGALVAQSKAKSPLGGDFALVSILYTEVTVILYIHMDRHKKGEIEKERQTKLENIEERIYSTDNPVVFRDRRSVLHDNAQSPSDNWEKIEDTEEIIRDTTEEDNTFFSKLSHRIFYSALSVFVVVVAISSYHFYFSSKTISNLKIGLAVEAPGYIDGGEDFPLDIYVTNKNKLPLERVDVVIEYPKGESITSKEDSVIKRVALGNVDPGATAKGSTDIVLYGREGSLRNISVYIEYYAPGSSVVLKKELVHTLTVKSAPVVITTESLKEATSNQEVVFTARIRAERGKDLENFLLNIDYPNGFQYISSEPEPRYGNNTWGFDTIKKGEIVEVKVKGLIRGEDGDERVFRTSGGSESIWEKGQIGVVFADTKSVIAVKKPFISLTGSFEGVPSINTGEFAIKPGERISGIIQYQNNVPDTISNVVVTARLSGEVLNRQKVVVIGGYYDSSKNLMIWNRTTNPTLAELLPNQTGELKFVVQSYALSSKQNGYFSQPAITIQTEVSGRRLSDVLVPEVNSISNPLVARVITDAGVSGSVVQGSAPFTQSGAVPPVADKPTSYTIKISAQNRSNTLTGSTVSFVLPLYVEYRSLVSPEGADVRYVEATRTITWNIGNIPPDTGFGRGEKSVSIGLVLTPSIGQIGARPEITGPLLFTATDSFTGTTLSGESRPVVISDIVGQ
jgi:hypothetical protein